MGNKYTKAYFKCPTCNSLDKERFRGASNHKRRAHHYRCRRCGTIASGGKIIELGDPAKFTTTSPYMLTVQGHQPKENP